MLKQSTQKRGVEEDEAEQKKQRRRRDLLMKDAALDQTKLTVRKMMSKWQRKVRRW